MASLPDVTRFISLFHDADRARSAMQALQGAGLAPDSIGDRSRNDPDVRTTLSSIGVPERDLKHLEDGLRNGGVIVTLEAPEGESRTIEHIFHRYSVDKVDEADMQVAGREPAALAAAPYVTEDAPLPATEGQTVKDEAVIPIAQESLLVGKREVDRGGVRIFRRTVEEPVQEDVTLHDERVLLEYREVNRPVTDADLRAGNQAIELVETAEVPVVEKVARVVEEVHVGRVESDRTEVVHDTVRHTEVEVEPVGNEDTNLPRN